MWRVVLCVWWACAACTKPEPAVESAACCTNDSPAHSHPEGDNSRQQQRAPDTTVMQSLLPSLRVLAEATGDSVTIHVQNHGVDPVQVSTRATLMRVTEGAAVSVGTYVLRDSCAREPQACVTLAPGAELIPPAWPGRKGHDQCAACAACDVITRGRYLVELKSCDGKNSAQASFELSAAP